MRWGLWAHTHVQAVRVQPSPAHSPQPHTAYLPGDRLQKEGSFKLLRSPWMENVASVVKILYSLTC